MDIALNTYSLRNEWGIFTIDGWKQGWEGPVLRVLKMLGVKYIELLDRHFEEGQLSEIQSFLKEHGIEIFSLGPHFKFIQEPGEGRDSVIKDASHWVDLAADHDIHYFRVGIGTLGPKRELTVPVDKAVDYVAATLEPVVQHAEERGVNIGIETHHAYSSNPEFQQKLMERLPSKNLGWIFDIGNYETRELCWDSLKVIKKKIFYMHAKAYMFDDQGFETTLDYPRAIKTMHDAGFTGKLSIEWEGKMMGAIGALKTNELLKHSLAQIKGESYEMKTDFGDPEDLFDQLMEG